MRIIAAHQDRRDLPSEIRAATLTASTIGCFRPTPEDAAEMAPLLYDATVTLRPEHIFPDVLHRLRFHRRREVQEFFQINNEQVDDNIWEALRKETRRNAILSRQMNTFEKILEVRRNELRKKIALLTQELNAYKATIPQKHAQIRKEMDAIDERRAAFCAYVREIIQILIHDPDVLGERRTQKESDVREQLLDLSPRQVYVRVGGSAAKRPQRCIVQIPDLPQAVQKDEAHRRQRLIQQQTRARYGWPRSEVEQELRDTPAVTPHEGEVQRDEPHSSWYEEQVPVNNLLMYTDPMRTPIDASHIFTLSGIDDRFLHAIYRYHMLKPEQLTRRYYSRGSLTFVKARLKRLTDHGYLEANQQPTTRGRSPFFYTLAGKGLKYLREAGFEVNRYYRPSRKVEYLPFLLHTYLVNDVLVAAELLVERQPHLTLTEMQHELTLKQDPCKVPTRRDGFGRAGEPATHHVTIVPDGWLDFRYDRRDGGAERRMCLWLEADRGTVGKKEFKAKAAAIFAFYQSGAYSKRFGTNSLRVAFATTAGTARVNQMRAWLRDALGKELMKPGIAERFVCTALPDEIDPRTLFLSPVWYIPADHSLPVPLLVIDS